MRRWQGAMEASSQSTKYVTLRSSQEKEAIAHDRKYSHIPRRVVGHGTYVGTTDAPRPALKPGQNVEDLTSRHFFAKVANTHAHKESILTQSQFLNAQTVYKRDISDCTRPEDYVRRSGPQHSFKRAQEPLKKVLDEANSTGGGSTAATSSSRQKEEIAKGVSSWQSTYRSATAPDTLKDFKFYRSVHYR
jgi:hypothetical protein